jgi:cytochrome P450
MGLAEHYDHFAQEYVVDPFPLWKRMREEEPVARSEVHGGYYIVSRYEDIREAASDGNLFSSAKSTGIPPLPIVGMIPIDIDPPEQREYRRILNPAFNVDAVAEHEPAVRELAVKLIEPLVGLDEFEVTETLATAMPPRTTLGFIGFPQEDWDVVIKAVDDITRLRGSDPQEVVEAGMALMGAVGKLIETRKAAPGNTLVDLIMAGRYIEPGSGQDPNDPDAGRPLEDHEVIRMIAIILFGAIDTTSLAITGSLHYLATHPEAQAELRSDGVSKTAVEELVRFTCPVQGLGRTVTADTTLGGCPLKAGEKVMLLWASGSRQESVFPEPDRLDFDRRPNPHLGFGHGPHKCVGLNFGKLMLRVALEEFLTRIGPFELADPDGLAYVGGETRGLKRLVLKPASGV